MTVTPQGQVYICKTPLENDYKNQLTFDTINLQTTYFNSKVQYTEDNYVYIKKDNAIRVGINIDKLINCNYLFYENNGFPNEYGDVKRYYCFITNMEYINENCTLITFETDVFQTWYFQLKYNKCFVEREHVNDDTIGLHTVPEGLETGEYVTNSVNYYNGLDDCYYVIQTTEWLNGTKAYATNYGGVFMAGGAYVTDSISVLVNIIQGFATAGKSDAVYNVYMIPKTFMSTTSGQTQYPGDTVPKVAEYTINKTTSIGSYTPINKKLLTFPYNYLVVSNNNGSSNILHYERFTTNNCVFKIKGVPTVGGSIKCVPENYDGIVLNEDEGLIAGKLPTLNWSDDEYTNWLTQNSVNIGLGIASSGITLISGLGMMATGGGALAGGSAVVSGAMGIAQTLGSIYEHSLQPNSAKGNVNGGDINVCDGKNGFFFYHRSIKPEYARIIDRYWNLFGYKVNLVKVPNIKGRKYWNYVKTIDCNVEGDIPDKDLMIIRNMFNNGVTLWHDPNSIYNYDNSNSII